MAYIIGIDEVGRGSLAGPVTVAAACIPSALRISNSKLGVLKDSKKLTAKQRNAWFEFFRSHPDVRYSLARVYPRTIERINISKAANLAALRAFRRLERQLGKQAISGIFLDGGLYLGNTKSGIRAKTVVKGDEKFSAIKIASIIAKVSRDKAMATLAKTYPDYGFEAHKGYGTKTHYKALRRAGPSDMHRLTFIKKYLSV